MAGTTQQDPNTVQNPNDTDYDRRFNDIQKAEEDGTFNDIVKNYDNDGNSGDNSSTTTNRDEEDPGRPGYAGKGSYYNNFTGAEKQKLQAINGVHFLRRKGPLAIILTIFLGGGIGFSALFSPGILLVQMKEVMVDKFNTQLASMDVRTTKILSAKIDNATSGLCTSVISMPCKYSSMSVKQVEKFKAAQIEVKYDSKSIVGRAKPTSFVFKGTEISAKDFSKVLATNKEFRKAVYTAYNPKYAGFADRIWSGFKTRFKISETDPKPAASDVDRQSNLDSDTKNGTTDLKRISSGDIDPVTKEPYTDDQIKLINDQVDSIDAGSKSGVKSASPLLDGVGEGLEAASGTAVSKALEFFKISGIADSACGAYTAVQAVGYAAKTVRAIQLARYAMAFMKAADMIKAGTANPEDIAWLGGIATEVVYDATSAVKRGSATDSAGYKFAAYGELGGFTNKNTGGYVSQFLAGGGLTGDLIGLTAAINGATGGTPKTTCAILGNPWVGAGSAVIGIAFMLVPGVGQAGTIAKMAAQGAAEVALSVGLMLLPELLKDIVAGNITSGIKGADSGNAITSGAGSMMSTVAGMGGNAPLTPDQAVAYSGLQTKTVAAYAQDEASSLNPLDPTSRYTFMGSIVSNLTRYTSQTSTLSGILSSLGSITQTAFSGIIPVTSAVTSEQYAASLNICQDYDLKNLTGDGTKSLATDPFCNVIYGLPEKYLNKDPLLVVNELIASGDISSVSGQPQGAYTTFITNCINRLEPLGSTGSDGTTLDGSECLINDSNANYYVHYIDERVSVGMDGYDEELPVAAVPTTTGTTTRPENTDSYGNGWNLRSGVDYSSYACDPRTEDKGIYTEPVKKYIIRICDTNIAGIKTTINSLITTNFMNMYEAAKAAGITFFMAEGLRKSGDEFYSAQSRHTAGLAMDLGSTQNSGRSFCYIKDGSIDVARSCRTRVGPAGDAVRWLDANAATYGFQNLNTEPWHWSTGETAGEFNK